MQHILHKSHFEQLLGTRPVARTEHFFVHRLAVEADKESLIGVMTPKRHAKRAVTRNLIKRQIYAQTGLNEALLLARHGVSHYLIRLRVEFARKDFPSAASEALKVAVRTELQGLITQLLK